MAGESITINAGDVEVKITTAESAKNETRRLADAKGDQWSQLLNRAKKL